LSGKEVGGLLVIGPAVLKEKKHREIERVQTALSVG
jgi:hypothetical protein